MSNYEYATFYKVFGVLPDELQQKQWTLMTGKNVNKLWVETKPNIKVHIND